MALEIVERPIAVSAIKSGMLINLSYTKVGGGGGNYFLFVINPSRTNTKTGSQQLHAYNFGGIINESQFVNILVDLNAAVILDTVNKELKLETLADTEAYEAKYVIPTTDARPYRIFNIPNIGSVTQLMIVLPEVLDSILTGNVSISDRVSKRKLFDLLQENNVEGIKELTEIKTLLGKTKSEQERLQEEASEREDLRQRRRKTIGQILRGFFGLSR